VSVAVPAGVQRAQAARGYLREHRRRRRPSLFTVYLAVLVVVFAGIFAHHLLATIVGGGLSRATVAGAGPAILALVLVGVLRIGVWQGPVSFLVADVRLLLTAPLSIVTLVRPKLDHAMAAGAAAGALLAVAAVLLSAGGVGAVGAARTVGAVAGLAAFGALAVAAGWLVESSRPVARGVSRAGPLLVLTAAALLVSVAGAVGRDIAMWSGPWGWSLAALDGRPGWPAATGLALLAAALVCGLARRRTAATGAEAFLDRAQTRSSLGAATFTLDYRGAALVQRQAAAQGRVARHRRVPRPRSPRAAILWRDALALVASPSRALTGGLLGAAAVVEAVTHPGRGLPAVVAAVALYAGAALLSEPLRIDVDRPDRSRLLLSRSFAQVLVAHCVLPTAVLSAAGALALAGLVLAGTAGPAALALVVSLLVPACAVAVLCASLASRRGGRIGPELLARILSLDPSSPIVLLAVLWLAPWLLLCLTVLGVAIALLGRAPAGHHAVLSPGLSVTVLAVAVAWALLQHARRSPTPDG
jgi:hypothetical protein